MSRSLAAKMGAWTGHADAVVDRVRKEIQVDQDVLKEAKKRRELVKEIASAYLGFVRTFNSGSTAHGTAKKPLPDADCGAVLDRRSHTAYGPDSELGRGPNELVQKVARFVEVEVRRSYPSAEVKITKRAIDISFNAPVGGEDPSVDLIVALTRRDEPGLWIPNTGRNVWNASDPEKHTELLTAEPKSLRVYRARLIRLAKVAVGRHDDKAVMISFNIEALALRHVTEVSGLAVGLRDLFLAMSNDIARGLTPDPAGVSPPIKLPLGITQETASRRLGHFANKIGKAVEHTHDETAVMRALAEVFPDQLPEVASDRADLASALRSGNASGAAALGLVGGTQHLSDSTRAFGDARS